MEEQWGRTYIPYSYTYDQFTVFFHGDRVYIGEQNYPIGQCCVDILNTDERVFDEIDRRVKDFVPAAWELLRVKSNSAVAIAQQKMNAIGDAIFALPVYRDLNMNTIVTITHWRTCFQTRRSGRWFRSRSRKAG